MKRIEVNLPDEDYKKLKCLCKLDKISISDKIKEIILDEISSADIANF